MKKQLFVLGMASVFALGGCHGISKTSFAKFKEAVDKIESVSTKEVKISGKVDGTKVSFTYEVPQSGWAALGSAASALTGQYNEYELTALGLIGTEAIGTYTISESDSLTYYTGMGFKVKAEKYTTERTSKGLLASYKSESASLSYSWKLNK